jgi:soluble lytic murein transglycosylase-like protein
MRTRSATIISLLTAVLTAVATFCAFADKLPSFVQVYASNDKNHLTAWGRRYARGVGVARDPKKALRLFCKSARKGDTDAKFELGQLYAFGQGVERDRDLAAAWYYQAARGKSRKAETMLRILKVDGKPRRKASCPVGAGTMRVASRHHPASGEIARMVRLMAPKYRLDPNLVLAVIETESGFNPKALSPKNAQGLMQLIPATASRFGVEDVWDPEQNLHGGMAYLRWLLDHFDGDVKLALAGYNAGEKAVEHHGGIPPYAETQAYVKRIIELIGGQG